MNVCPERPISLTQLLNQKTSTPPVDFDVRAPVPPSIVGTYRAAVAGT